MFQNNRVLGPVGRFLEDNGTANWWWLHDGLADCELCSPGRFANQTASSSCLPCASGSFTARYGSTVCTIAEPGFYVQDASVGQLRCPAGRVSVGGADSCRNCSKGEYQSYFGETQCIAAEPGRFVNITGATESMPCPPGRFSLGGSASCEECEVGEFQPRSGQPSCRACPAPMTTKGNGSTYCDACIQSYFWNSLHWNAVDQDSVKVGSQQQCVDCCNRCVDICEVDDENCVDCNDDGAVLETLDVKQGWWRATPASLTVYECSLDRACRGGDSTAVSEQCFDGHIGYVFLSFPPFLLPVMITQ